MTTRTMIDMTGGNAQAVRRSSPHADLVAWYGTGSPDIYWTGADLAAWRGFEMVEIDQGFTGSPVAAATVRDVENGAWSAGEAVRHVPWTAERPTIYCDRSTLPAVAASGWRGDVWLAWPGFSGNEPPAYHGVNIVAVQNFFGANYDTSVVFDPYWPHKSPVNPSPSGVSLTITERVFDLAFPVSPGADHYVISYRASGSAVAQVIARPPQREPGTAVHVAAAMVPGGNGGIVSIDAIIAGAATRIGQITLT